MVFQHPIPALDPAFRVGARIEEVRSAPRDCVRSHGVGGWCEMLDKVGIPDPAPGATTTLTTSPAACGNGS